MVNWENGGLALPNMSLNSDDNLYRLYLYSLLYIYIYI